MIEEDCKLISLFKNNRDSAIMLNLLGGINKQGDLEYLNSFFVASNSKNSFKSLHAF